jgi:sulfur-carrier protein
VAVRVRMFAALREAAGTEETTAFPGPLPVILDDLCGRYGERFARRLAVASVLVDGTAVARGARVEVPDEAEVALLPPVSGGSPPARRQPDCAGECAADA